MIEYQKVTIEDTTRYMSYLDQCIQIPSDCSPAVVYCYGKNDNIVRRYSDGFCWQKAERYLLPPVGEWNVSNWAELMEKNLPEMAVFLFVPEFLVKKWKEQLPEQLTIEEKRGEFDYLYYLDEQIAAKGRDFQEFRRQLRLFKKNYQCKVQAVSSENLEVLESIERRFIEKAKAEGRYNQSMKEEEKAFFTALHNWDLLGIKGKIFWVNGKPKAFFVWEELDGMTAIGLFTKFDHSIKGLWAQIQYDIYCSLHAHGFLLINQMNDEDVKGLRRMKLNQRPLVLMKKYMVTYRKKS